MKDLMIRNAYEGNLKNVSVKLPHGKFIVLTGLSGSGKSTLAVDVLFHECQRQYLEAMGMQGIQKPKVEAVRHISPAILIARADANKNPRSTVGTVTNLYTDLRMIYEKLGVRTCPYCGSLISAADCHEHTEKRDGEFYVYMDCCQCGRRMDKLTRSHFSHNTREGACQTCQGMGNILTVNEEAVLKEKLSLEEGAVAYWEQKYGEYQTGIFYQALRYYGIPVNPGTPVSEFTPAQKQLLLYGTGCDDTKAAFPGQAQPRTAAEGKFEGAYTILWRRLSEKGGEGKQLENYFVRSTCPDCGGERLNDLSRKVLVEDKRIAELAQLSLTGLLEWICQLEKSLSHSRHSLTEAYLLDIKTKLQRIIRVGLGYLSLDRQTGTLSGGEGQRIRLAAALDSDLTGVIYLLDEPTVGLHPKDTAGMVTVLKKLRDSGNTVIVIEHDTDVMREADLIVDMGPGAGKHGGEIVAIGTLEELKKTEISPTGRILNKPQACKTEFRAGSGGWLRVKNGTRNNLKGVAAEFPTGCLTAVTGVSGSGKSTLVFGELAEGWKKGGSGCVTGQEEFEDLIVVEQSAITRMKRSNVATYSEAYGEIRKLFGSLPEAKKLGLTAKDFSFNSPGGRCECCQGLGFIVSNMLFFQDIEVTCPECGGKQFSDKVLSIRYKGCSVHEILKLSVEEAACLFHDRPKLAATLELLEDVGLGYLELGQTLTTLSGGEGQRLKLAKELINHPGRKAVYLLDEPTTGLHPQDVEHFMVLLNRIVDNGNTVIVVEHNQQVISQADWVVDLGPGGGDEGGQIVFAGTSRQLLVCGDSVTAQCMREACD